MNDLIQASNEYETLQSIIDNDVKHNTVRHKGSHSRNLRRVRLGLGLIQALFENFLATKYVFSFVLSFSLPPAHAHTTAICMILILYWCYLVISGAMIVHAPVNTCSKACRNNYQESCKIYGTRPL